jgi:hypothetical protein
MNKFWRCEGNIKCILNKYVICDNMHWIQVAQFGVQWQALMNRKGTFGFIYAGEFPNWLTCHQLLNNINTNLCYCLIASVINPFLRLHHQRIEIFVTRLTMASTNRWWWRKQLADLIHSKSTLFLMAAVIYCSNEFKWTTHKERQNQKPCLQNSTSYTWACVYYS